MNTVMVVYRDEHGLDTELFPTWGKAREWAETQPAPYVIVPYRLGDAYQAHLVRGNPRAVPCVDDEPWCNHDPAGVTDGRCECGVIIYVVDEDEPDGGYVIYDEGRYEVTLFGEYETGPGGVATFTEATEILRAAIAELHLHPQYRGVDIPCFYVRDDAIIMWRLALFMIGKE